MSTPLMSCDVEHPGRKTLLRDGHLGRRMYCHGVLSIFRRCGLKRGTRQFRGLRSGIGDILRVLERLGGVLVQREGVEVQNGETGWLKPSRMQERWRSAPLG